LYAMLPPHRAQAEIPHVRSGLGARTGGCMTEFKEFLLKTNALALAVGVIIGGAVGKVVSSMVSDLLMPPIGLLVGNLDFSSLLLNLSTTHYATLEEAKKAGAPTLNYGMFLNNVIDFDVIAFCVYMIPRIAM